MKTKKKKAKRKPRKKTTKQLTKIFESARFEKLRRLRNELAHLYHDNESLIRVVVIDEDDYDVAFAIKDVCIDTVDDEYESQVLVRVRCRTERE